MVAAVFLVLLGASPFIYRALPTARSLKLTKVAVLVAFSGRLQARGNDVYAATQLGVDQANADGKGRSLTIVSALDDQGQPQEASNQARGVAADPGVGAVLCCSTDGAEQAVAGVLPAREHLLSMLTDAPRTASAEAMLARRQFGAGTVVVISDGTIAQDVRVDALQLAFRSAGDTVTVVPVNFATGSQAEPVAAAVAQLAPSLVVLDMDFPAAAVMGAALRSAGETAPLLGDDRLDGAPAAALLGNLADIWYVAADRDALLRQAPSSFAPAFNQARGHAPSARDVLAYLQVRAATHDGVAPVQPNTLPLVLYRMAPGVYPGPVAIEEGSES